MKFIIFLSLFIATALNLVFFHLGTESAAFLWGMYLGAGLVVFANE